MQSVPIAATAAPARTGAPTLSHVHPATLLPVADDIRDRTAPDYREWFDRLVADVRLNGIRVPIIVYREGVRCRVIDGETRRLCCLMAGNVEAVPILIYEQKPDDAALKLAQFQANAMRLGMSPLECAAVYADLMKLNGWSHADLSRRIHVSPAQIAKCLAISAKLCPEVQEMVAAGDVPPRAAYAISRCDPAMQFDLARKVKDGLLCVEGLEIHLPKLNGRKVKQKPVKLSLNGVVVQISGDVVEGLRAFVGKATEALKRLDKDNLPPDVLPSLMRS
jgi:ParB/RepB/Spo0J family partition protein